MFTRWNEFDRSFETMDNMFRRMFDPGAAVQPAMGLVFRGSRLIETDDAVVLTTDLPGVRNDDVEVSLQEGVLTVQATRQNDAPEGYEPQRIERSEARFARTFTLPSKVDPERTRATLERGVLTIHMEKAPDAKPRRIAINA